ncbi:MAG: hypothetical protein AB1816_16145 [Bacillota bacterium]
MTPSDLLAELKRRGITLRPEGADAIRYTAPKGAMTDELRALIREHKAALLALLSAGSTGQEEAVSSPAPGIALALSLQPDGTCYCCKGSRWWLSRYGVLVCATCHPPAVPELVARYVDGGEAVRLAHA